MKNLICLLSIFLGINAEAAWSPYWLQKSVVTLSAAQIESAFATPILILPSVSGKIIHLISVNYEYLYGGTPFVVTSGQVAVQSEGISPPWTSAEPTAGLLDQTSNTEAYAVPGAPGNSMDVRDLGLVFQSFDSGISGGNGSLRLVMYYMVLD